MKNDECIIYICNSKGRILQSVQKENGVWTQTTLSNCVKRPMTAEQLLSHILPPLAGVSPAKLRVVSLNVPADTSRARVILSTASLSATNRETPTR